VAAHHLTPVGDVGDNVMSIEEAVEFLRPTGHPVTAGQLQYGLRASRRKRIGRAYVYPTADILEWHRDHVAAPAATRG